MMTGKNQRRAAFTLVEVVMVIGVISFALVAIIGVLPAGMNASKDATNQTMVSLILEDVHNRLQLQPLTPGAAAFSPAYFDDRGVYISPNPSSPTAATLANAYYRADVTIGTWNSAPANTSSLRPVTVALSWPVNPGTGNAIGPKNPQATVAFGVTSLAGPAWQSVDPTYVPKVEF